jgi:hypothetical protein
VLMVTILANYTESNFAWMTPIGFLFLTATIGHAEAASVNQHVGQPMAAPTELEEANFPLRATTASFRD